MQWCVYIVECKDFKLYTGITNNIKRRLMEHNSGNGCRFTKFRYPVTLLYKEDCKNRKAAAARERQIKSFKRTKKLELIELLRSKDSMFNLKI